MRSPLVPSALLPAFEASYARYAEFNALRSLREEDSALETFRLGGLLCQRDPTRSSASYYNRIDGLSEASLELLDDAFDWFDDVDRVPRLDVAAERTTLPVAEALFDRGYSPGVGITVLVARPDEVAPAPGGSPPLRRLGPSEADAFLDLLDSEAEEDDEPISLKIRAKQRRFFCTDDFRTWVAEVAGEPVAWATMWVDGAIGVLGNAYTLEAHRGLAAQRALFASRARDAHELGLEWLWTDVTPLSTSHRNAERMGFRTATTQLWWSPVDDEP